METFDWDKAEVIHGKVRTDWLRENHTGKIVTEQMYIDFHRSLRKTDVRPEKAKRYSISRLRGQFQRLKKKYGFFI